LPHAASLFGAYKVEARGVFRLRLVQQPPGAAGAAGSGDGAGGASVAAPPAAVTPAPLISPLHAADELRVLRARAQLRQSERRRLLGGSAGDDSGGEAAPAAAAVAAGAAQLPLPSWQGLPTAELPRALCEARAGTLRRAGAQLLAREALKVATADAYYSARVAATLAVMSDEAHARARAVRATSRATVAARSPVNVGRRLPAAAATAAASTAGDGGSGGSGLTDAARAAPCALCRAPLPHGQPAFDLCSARNEVAALALAAGDAASALQPFCGIDNDDTGVRSVGAIVAALRAQDADARAAIAAHLL
jgi:hypothetical protein